MPSVSEGDAEPAPLVIIGAGPAGLAAAVGARSQQSIVLEAGPPLHLRDQSDPATAIAGVGGAGLYSDGKFSFWPSASRLWALDQQSVRLGYEFLSGILARTGLRVPDLTPSNAETAGHAGLKRYPSYYVTPEHRDAIIRDLVAECVDLRTDHTVVGLTRAEGVWRIRMGDGELFRAERLVVAGGRFAPLLLADALSASSLVTRRLEVGVRIEQPSDSFFAPEDLGLDPKIIIADENPSYEWRTFCCCRNGTVMTTSGYGLTTLSGRADCPPTGRSNIGFNLRLKDAYEAEHHWRALRAKLMGNGGTASQSLASFLDGTGPVADLLGPEITARLAEGLNRLMDTVGVERFGGANVAGPVIEGVATYPRHDGHLAVPGCESMWVAGDVAGDFRGLTAAIVSGYIAGHSVTMSDREHK